MTVDITTTMGLTAEVDKVIPLQNKGDILHFSNEVANGNLNWFILGEGSNTVIGNDNESLVIGKMQIKGVELEDLGQEILVKVGAGENWDELVRKMVEGNLSGIEALSGIPGTVGAAPVQNIGAYGAEVARVLEYIEAYDMQAKDFVIIQKEDCDFSYRNSLFKKNPGRYIIILVAIKLLKDKSPKIPDYKDVVEFFTNSHNPYPTLQEIRDVIIKIRQKKLPDPKIIPNCGSFFKNPIVPNGVVEKIKAGYPDMPTYPLEDRQTKIPAGWLLEKAGFKGATENGVGTHEHNALVIVNKGGAEFKDLENFVRKIKTGVLEMFGIKLEEEVNIINS